MSNKRIGITLGCPVGIGPEIILQYFKSLSENIEYEPIVIGDIGVLRQTASHLSITIDFSDWHPGESLPRRKIPVFNVSKLDATQISWGKPNKETGQAMASYIEAAVQLEKHKAIDAITTCPISKYALQQAGYSFPGHTEMLAELTTTKKFTMMMAGEKLRVILVTIHCSLKEAINSLNTAAVIEQIQLTHSSLMHDFALDNPRIAVAGLNPHSGEDGLFGNEEAKIIAPAIAYCQQQGINATGPFPPDTVFYQASQGKFDTVVCMYHDQGLIPFKLIHFNDGVNVTLGLPLVRTSVDHGTAYDIAGQGIASSESLAAAVGLAAQIASNREKNIH